MDEKILQEEVAVKPKKEKKLGKLRAFLFSADLGGYL